MMPVSEGYKYGNKGESVDSGVTEYSSEGDRYRGVDVIRTRDRADAEPMGKEVRRGGDLHGDLDVVPQESTTEEVTKLRVKDYQPNPDVNGESCKNTSRRGLKDFLYWVPLGTGVEGARRAGKDRKVEAGLAENLHAKEYVRQNGGSVNTVTSSPFQPDNGIDKTIKQKGVEKTMQVKHYGEPVGEWKLSQYESIIDIFSSTNGFKEGVNPSEHGMESFTYDDWSWRAKLELEVARVIQGSDRALSWVRKQVIYTGELSVKQAKLIGRKGVKGTASAASFFWRRFLKRFTLGMRKLANRAVTKFLQQSLKRKALSAGGLILILIILWYWRSRTKE